MTLEPSSKTVLIQTLQIKNNKTRYQMLQETLRLDHLPAWQREQVIALLWKFSDRIVLKGEPINREVAVGECTLPTKPCHPQAAKMYRIPEKYRPIVEVYTKEHLEQGILKNSTSPWNAPCLVVPKKADASGETKWRVVIDYRRLNEQMPEDEHPLPNIDDIIDRLGRAKYFTTLDLASGFHQISIKPEDQPKTAFSTHEGHYEYTRMPFGLKNAPRIFQRIINSALAGIIGNEAFVYLDDIIIFSESFEDHLMRLRHVLSRLRSSRLLIQPDKCEFVKASLVYLGHIISEKGLQPMPEKTQKLRSYPRPTNIKEIQIFLGFCNYYRRYIPDFATLAMPLYKLTNKNIPFKWTEQCEENFEKLKQSIADDAVLSFPQFDKLFYLHTDASEYAIGAVLSQKDEEDNLRPITFESKILSAAQRNYATIEKEFYAIVWAVQKFRPYLLGQKFEILSDHKPLQWASKVRDTGARLMRWKLKLEEYDY